jgi:hypothetical protein
VKRAARTHQRRYRRSWLERRCGVGYRQIASALARCGRSLRTTSDEEVVRLVRERLRLDREARDATEDAVVELVIEIGRSRRWILATLKQLDLSARDRPAEALREARDRAQQRASAARKKKRAPKAAVLVVAGAEAANTTLATAV